jgi:cell division protein FtsB
MAVEDKRTTGRAIAVVMVGIAAYYAIWAGEYTAFDLRRLAVQQQAEAVLLAEARHEADSLKVVVDLLENDNLTIETVARERFGMIRSGEILYRFVEVDDPPAEAVGP